MWPWLRFSYLLALCLLEHWPTVLLGALVLAFYWYATLARRSIQRTFPGLPGPKPWPLINHLPDAFKAGGEMHLMFDMYYKRYGGQMYTMSFNRVPALVIGDTEAIKTVLIKDFDSFYNRPEFFTLPEPIDVAMTAARDETWKRIRTTLSPTFSAHKLRTMVPLINNACDTLLVKLDSVATTGESFDVAKYQQTVTLDAIISTVFGVQSECQTRPDDPIMARALSIMQPNIFLQILAALVLPLFPYGAQFPTSKIGAKIFFGSLFDLSEFVKGLIAERKKQGSVRKDILDLMLSATTATNENKKLSDDEIMAQCVAFLLAGYETSSTTISLLCYHLATDSDVQEKLLREIDGVWSDEDKMPSYETVHELPYLEMVLSETLRLYPPGFNLLRECSKDTILQGTKVPKGTPVAIPVYSIHRDPKYYPSPEKFDPDRFSAEAKQSRDPYTYLPFGLGPHSCIGMRFAQMEMKLVLVRILKKFKFRATAETIIPPRLSCRATLIVPDGIVLAVDRRA